jgi:cobalt-zinc-cadmium efflux system outer membrane protein
MRSILLAFLLGSAFLLGAAVAAADEAVSLRRLTGLAVEHNPEIESLRAQAAALRGKVEQAGAWKNPRLTFAYQNVPWDSFSLGEEPMSMMLFRLEQTVPFPGKPGKREKVVQKEAEAKNWEIEERRSQLRALVKRAYYELSLSRQLEKLTDKHVSLIEQLIDAVRVKYEVGRAPQRDLLRLEVLRDRLKDDLSDFRARDRTLTAAINAAVHRRSSTPVATPAELGLAAPAKTVDDYRALAAKNRPLLKQLGASAAMHRSEAELSRYEAAPDLTFFAAYGLRTDLPGDNTGRDLVTLGLSLPLPVFYGSNYGARADRAGAQALSYHERRKAARDRIEGGLAEALAAWTRAAEKQAHYRDTLVPAARRALDATLSDYQVDRADFLSLYEAERELLGFEMVIRRAAVEGLVARATIEMLTGKELP